MIKSEFLKSDFEIEEESNIPNDISQVQIAEKSSKKDKINIEYEQDKQIDIQIKNTFLQIFPYPHPYEIQLDSMQQIVQSLCDQKNLLLQSPTGTGKTLVTICSALAYIENKKDVQVLVLTRTSEQINGFIKEIRKISKYKDIANYSILAGRKQFCQLQNKFKDRHQLNDRNLAQTCQYLVSDKIKKKKKIVIIEDMETPREYQISQQQDKESKEIVNMMEIFSKDQIIELERIPKQQNKPKDLDQNSLYQNQPKNSEQNSKQQNEPKVSDQISLQQNQPQDSVLNSKQQSILKDSDNNFKQQISEQQDKESQEIVNMMKIFLKDQYIELERIPKQQNKPKDLDQNSLYQNQPKNSEQNQKQQNEPKVSDQISLQQNQPQDSVLNSKQQSILKDSDNNSKQQSIPENSDQYSKKQYEKTIDTCPYFQIYQKIIDYRIQNKKQDKIYFPKVRYERNEIYSLPDIEDMNNLFNQNKLGCPYYFNKLAARSAKLIFTTYNYVIKQNILGKIKDYFQNKVIVVFDEGHNVPEQYIESLIEKDIEVESYFLDNLLKKAQKNDQSEQDMKLDDKINSNDLQEKKCNENIHVRSQLKLEPLDDQKKYQLEFNNSVQGIAFDLYDKVLKAIYGDFDKLEKYPELQVQINKLVNNIQDKDNQTTQDNTSMVGKQLEESETTENQKIIQTIQDNNTDQFYQQQRDQEIFNCQQINQSLQSSNTFQFNKELEQKEIFYYQEINQTSQGVSIIQIDNQNNQTAQSDIRSQIDLESKQKEIFDQQENKKTNTFQNDLELKQKELFNCQQNNQIAQGDNKSLQINVESRQKVNFESQENNKTLQETFQLYKKLRKDEVVGYFKNFLNQLLQITENKTYQGLSELFDKQNLSKPFCYLFNQRDQITKCFQTLNFQNDKKIQSFIIQLQKLYIMLQYLKTLLQNENKKQQENSDQQDQTKQKAKSQNYDLEKFEQKIEIKNIQKIWFQFHRLLNIKKYYDRPVKDHHYLQNHYFQYIREELPQNKILRIGCHSASYLFEEIKQKIDINSLIITSGTLEPFDLIQKQIGLEFNHYSTPPILNSISNLYTHFITHHENQEINFSKNILDDQEQKYQVFYQSYKITKQIIQNFDQYTQQIQKKAGIVIFFKSYDALNYFSDQFQLNIPNFKLYLEQKCNKDFQKKYIDYKKNIEQNKSNCIFLAVNKGKLSEGIDLKDDLCRIVIILGIPYQCFDAYIKCKRLHAKLYLQESNYYEKDAVRVVNQSAGRCIRHKNDWGCIFFLGFNHQMIKQNISNWIQEGQKTKEKDLNDQSISIFQNFLSEKAKQHIPPEKCL
ncbi:hypothetical protein ABPG73_012662 [Tetrahymena malaccensis]